ncbi:transmembrane protein 117-like [Branchiostoma floridae x Branchiostoma japonicum]
MASGPGKTPQDVDMRHYTPPNTPLKSPGEGEGGGAGGQDGGEAAVSSAVDEGGGAETDGKDPDRDPKTPTTPQEQGDQAQDAKDEPDAAMAAEEAYDEPDRASMWSVHMIKDFRYYFQHPYARLFVAYLVVFCNFLMFAEDPVSHGITPANVIVVGNIYSFIVDKYPGGAWNVFKVFMWLLAIVVGMILGKFLVHKLFFGRLLRLKMFHRDGGSWFIMFLTTLMSLFIFSNIYNGIILAAGLNYDLQISDVMGLRNSSFMKAAALGTWMGDFVTAWMVTDMMLQDTLYETWARPVRHWWRQGWHRIILFWTVLLSLTGVVVMVITTDYIDWDYLNRGFLPTNELSRAFLASFILVMDLLIVMQDWDFPHFMGSLDIKLPGINTTHIRLHIPKCLRKDEWTIHVTGKWFNYGIIMLVIILDLNMWKNQIFYKPFDYGQYVGPDDSIHFVRDIDTLQGDLFNRTTLTYDWRANHTDPATNLTYLERDLHMHSKYIGFTLGVKGIAFVPGLMAFVTFGVLIWWYGRFKPNEKDPHADRYVKRKRSKRRRLWQKNATEPKTTLVSLTNVQPLNTLPPPPASYDIPDTERENGGLAVPAQNGAAPTPEGPVKVQVLSNV